MPEVFKFIVIDLQAGEPVGTNDEKVAKEFAQSDDYFVIDTSNSTWLMDNANIVQIQEQRTYELSGN